MIEFRRKGWNCRWYPDTSTLVMSRNGCQDRALEPTARRYDLTLVEHLELTAALSEKPEQAPEEMYNALVNAGEDPSRAAHIVDMEFGLVDPMPDPFSPDYQALGRGPVTSQYADSRDSAEGASVQ